MARLRRLVSSGRVFFVTTNLNRRLSVFRPNERDLLCQALAEVRTRRGFRLAGFVIMPDHLHLLVLPGGTKTISALVQAVKYVTGRRINAWRGSKGSLWQKGFFDRFMRTPKEILEALDYMHQNPVRKGLAAAATDWRWSSAAAYAGLDCPITVDFLELPAQPEQPLR